MKLPERPEAIEAAWVRGEYKGEEKVGEDSEGEIRGGFL